MFTVRQDKLSCALAGHFGLVWLFHAQNTAIEKEETSIEEVFDIVVSLFYIAFLGFNSHAVIGGILTIGYQCC